MFVIFALSPRGPRLARSYKLRLLDAVRAATAMRGSGCWGITIMDGGEGKPRPLDWWLTALDDAKIER